MWDTATGFGGNGSPDGIKLHNGGCLMDGPFANTTRYFLANSHGHSHETEFQPHCLSRGFLTGPMLSSIKSLVSPSYVEQTLNQPDYSSFFKTFETGAHNAIPQFISGDFLTFTAPNGKKTSLSTKMPR